MALTSPVSSGRSPPLFLGFSACLVVQPASDALAARGRLRPVHGADLPGKQRGPLMADTWHSTALCLNACVLRCWCLTLAPIAACTPRTFTPQVSWPLAKLLDATLGADHKVRG